MIPDRYSKIKSVFSMIHSTAEVKKRESTATRAMATLKNRIYTLLFQSFWNLFTLKFGIQV